MSIRDWPEGERPREKLLSRGAEALSDAELLAIFLRVGVRGKSAVDLARDLLTQFGSLRGLLAADRKGFCAQHARAQVERRAPIAASHSGLHPAIDSSGLRAHGHVEPPLGGIAPRAGRSST